MNIFELTALLGPKLSLGVPSPAFNGGPNVDVNLLERAPGNRPAIPG